MGKFSKVLLVSDFDRTMTDRRSQIPAANLRAVEAFMAEGGAFTIATGRSLTTARYRFRDIPMNAPLLAFNGAACCDLHSGELLFCHPLPADGTALMERCVARYPDLVLEVHCLEGHFMFHPTQARLDYLESQHAQARVCQSFDQVPELRINFAIYSSCANPYRLAQDTPEALRFKALEQSLNEEGQGRYVAINSLPGMVEVQSADGSKGLAARELTQMLGRETLVCVGDAPNDISMLDEADLAFLAADGDEAMQLRGYEQAAACADGTVADVIRQLEARF